MQMKCGGDPSMGGAGAQAALDRTAALISALAPKDFPNGVVVYCSRELSEAMHPLRRVPQPRLRCEQDFDTSAVAEALRERRALTYGLVVITGDAAILGTSQASTAGAGPARCHKVAVLSASIASRTRRGGQSAARYSRNRDREELAFLRKVADTVCRTFGGVRGVVVGGPASMKRKLAGELSVALRRLDVRTVDLDCRADLDGLRQLALCIRQVSVSDQENEAEAAVNGFMSLLSQTEMREAHLACYGEAETMAALRMGAVRELLVSRAHADPPNRKMEMWRELAAASGASLVEVHPNSGLRARFCDGFGVGACLRYRVDASLLEESEPVRDDSPTPTPEDTAPCSTTGSPDKHASDLSDSDDASTTAAPSEARSRLHDWLLPVLAQAFGDSVAAEAIAIGVDVVLCDETLPMEERMEAVHDMLRGEGISEDVLAELSCHVCDLF